MREEIENIIKSGKLSDKTLRLFAVWCVRRIMHHNTDPRVKNAIDVAERYAHGLATKAELDAAYSTAWSAAQSAVLSVALSSARSAPLSAYWSAARSAPLSAVASAYWSALSDADTKAQLEELKRLLIFEDAYIIIERRLP